MTFTILGLGLPFLSSFLVVLIRIHASSALLLFPPNCLQPRNEGGGDDGGFVVLFVRVPINAVSRQENSEILADVNEMKPIKWVDFHQKQTE